jgi:hypothetical protein
MMVHPKKSAVNRKRLAFSAKKLAFSVFDDMFKVRDKVRFFVRQRIERKSPSAAISHPVRQPMENGQSRASMGNSEMSVSTKWFRNWPKLGRRSQG